LGTEHSLAWRAALSLTVRSSCVVAIGPYDTARRGSFQIASTVER
jgi:hypothetical protein